MTVPPKILVLAGTSEARAICRELSRRGVAVVASLSGAVSNPADYEAHVRVGGFGGTAGLADYMRADGITALVDATHPFALRISTSAAQAANSTGIPFARLDREPWKAGSTDHWHEFESVRDAIAALPRASVAFAALGGRSLGRGCYLEAMQSRADVRFVARSIEPQPHADAVPNCKVMVARPNQSTEQEIRMFREEGITSVLCRNSGGCAGRAKIDAANRLGLPAFLVAMPKPTPMTPGGTSFVDPLRAVRWAESVLGTTNG